MFLILVYGWYHISIFVADSSIFCLTHWGRVTHICVSKLTIIGSENGLSPGRRQAIIWTNAEILLIGPLGTKFSEILIEIHTFSFKKMHLKMSSGKWRPFCLGLNVLNLSMSYNIQLANTWQWHWQWNYAMSVINRQKCVLTAQLRTYIWIM